MPRTIVITGTFSGFAADALHGAEPGQKQDL
jgi:hypothetical protein